MSTGFGSSGPPATDKQLAYLEALLRKAGHGDWGDARRALGLTSKQGRGKFTKSEASALIDRLTATDDTPTSIEPDGAEGSAIGSGPLAGFPSAALADELRRRGWTVTPPD